MYELMLNKYKFKLVNYENNQRLPLYLLIIFILFSQTIIILFSYEILLIYLFGILVGGLCVINGVIFGYLLKKSIKKKLKIKC